MLLFELIAEQRIAEAIERGELADLPGAGSPLDLGDDALVPRETRMAYRILKNAGFIPPELEVLREIAELERLIGTLADGPRRGTALKKLELLRLRREVSARRPCAWPDHGRYRDRILERLG